MLKKLAVACLSTLLLPLLAAPAAHAWAPTAGPVFNNPKGNQAAQFRLQMTVEDAIRHTPKGAMILISTYLLDRVASVDALIAARNRGVLVHVVLDGGISNPPSRRLKTVLNRDNGKKKLRWGPDGSFAKSCKGSCRGGGDNQAMHAKFFAFSQTGKAKNVVMVSSANLNKGGALLGYNDLFTMVGVPKTYEMYKMVHDEMARDKVDGDPYVVLREGRFESQVFPKRGAKRSTDPTFRALRRVKCHGAAGGAGRNGRTVIRVAMFHWGGDRGEYLAKKILSLHRDGCIVSVIYGAPSKIVSQMLRNSAYAGGIELYDSRVDRNEDGEVDLRVHSKYLLINGNYDGDSSSWQVFAGSQNWTKGSLTGGDENTLQISSRPAYASYSKNFDFVRVNGARKIGRATTSREQIGREAAARYHLVSGTVG